MSTTEQALFENAYIEAKEIVAEREQPLIDQDIMPLQEQFRVNLVAGAIHYVNTYGGSSQFVRSLKMQLVKHGQLSLPQIRGALNVLRSEVRADQTKVYSRKEEVSPIAVTEKQAEGPKPMPAAIIPVPDASYVLDGIPTKDDAHQQQCYTCKRWFETVRTVMNHKSAGRCVPAAKETKAVMNEERAVKTFLDITSLPNGNYSFPRTDGHGEKSYVSLQVRTLARPMKEDRRYKYGKVRHGNEFIPAGTIQVRQWSGDTKELVGMQRPGEGYDGQFVEEIVQIMSNPQFCAQLFATFNERCYICGKTLNDDISVALQIGPDCQKQYGLDYLRTFKRSAPLHVTVTP